MPPWAFQTLIGTVKSAFRVEDGHIVELMFQTLIGTVKRGHPQGSIWPPCCVSNPHRYGQKLVPSCEVSVRGLGVSNPHRYGQKLSSFTMDGFSLPGFKPS